MKNKLYICMCLILSMFVFFGCARGDVEEYGVATGREDTDNRVNNDLYRDDDLFMEDVEEGVDAVEDTVEEGVDALEDGLTDDAPADTKTSNEQETNTGTNGQM